MTQPVPSLSRHIALHHYHFQVSSYTSPYSWPPGQNQPTYHQPSTFSKLACSSVFPYSNEAHSYRQPQLDPGEFALLHKQSARHHYQRHCLISGLLFCCGTSTPQKKHLCHSTLLHSVVSALWVLSLRAHSPSLLLEHLILFFSKSQSGGASLFLRPSLSSCAYLRTPSFILDFLRFQLSVLFGPFLDLYTHSTHQALALYFLLL